MPKNSGGVAGSVWHLQHCCCCWTTSNNDSDTGDGSGGNLDASNNLTSDSALPGAFGSVICVFFVFPSSGDCYLWQQLLIFCFCFFHRSAFFYNG